ncbi:MAG TPA: hypothetical protein VEU30_03785 [Thermoanaerobaculia bacterium]|nr:hypothetical protein [Thermoanaerobaculia bacterium]
MSVLISATIATGPDGVFAVGLDTAGAPLPEEETFRFALHYYGRVLYEMVHTQRSVRRLPEWTSRIAATELDRDVDFFAVADVQGALVTSLARPMATAYVTLRPAGLRGREVVGDLAPLRGSTLARSVLAVFQAVAPRLSDAMLTALPAALANMNASYELTHQYADPVSHREVPSVAYLAASFT